MRSDLLGRGSRFLLLALLAAGWFVGLVSQRATVEATGYMDITPERMLLGSGLCVLAGVAAHVLAPGHRRVRFGALAGVGMMVAMVAGYWVLAFAYWDRIPAGDSGETWYTVLLESWFWVGVPLLLSATLGAIGWLIAELPSRIGGSRPLAHPR